MQGESQQLADKELVKQRIRQEQARMKIRDVEGEYKFDNPELEYKTKRQRKVSDLEDKYKDKPKIAFHELDEEGNRLFMQAKRDQVMTTLGWSAIGNIPGIMAVQFFDARPPKRYQGPKFVKHREFFKIAVFLGTVGVFTIYGFGKARQTFVKAKIDIVEKHSVRHSDQ